MPLPGAPSALIVDGANGVGGNPAFFFLPPLAVNPPSSAFGEFDPDALPTIEVCRQAAAQGPCGEIVLVVAPTEIDGSSEQYHYGLDMSGFTTPRPTDEEFFRINVMVGSTANGIIAELGTRDIAVNYPLCGDGSSAVMCVGQNSNVSIKFRIDRNASCFTPGVAFPDPNCATATVHGTATTVTTGDGGAWITAPALNLDAGVGDRYALRFQEVPFAECDLGALNLNEQLGLKDGNTFHPLQWAQFPICYRVLTAVETGADVDINDVVTGLAEYRIYFDHPGETFPSADLLRLARMSSDRTELQILARADDSGLSEAPSLPERIMRFARELLDGTLFAPRPAVAASATLTRDNGVGGLGGGSTIGVVYPASLNAPSAVNDTVYLGVVAPGAIRQVSVNVLDTDGAGVQYNDVTFAPSNGDAFNTSTTASDVRSDGFGAAGGTWTISGTASGVRTLNASCFPCSVPPVTGDDQSDVTASDPNKTYYDDLFPFSQHLPQTITFKAVVLSLSVDPIPSRAVVGELFPVTVCIGASVPDITVDFAGRANNGTPTEVLVNGVPGQHSLNTSDVTFLTSRPGCFTTMISVTKEGGVKLIVSIRDSNLAVETNKSNIRPQ